MRGMQPGRHHGAHSTITREPRACRRFCIRRITPRRSGAPYCGPSTQADDAESRASAGVVRFVRFVHGGPARRGYRGIEVIGVSADSSGHRRGVIHAFAAVIDGASSAPRREGSLSAGSANLRAGRNAMDGAVNEANESDLVDSTTRQGLHSKLRPGNRRFCLARDKEALETHLRTGRDSFALASRTVLETSSPPGEGDSETASQNRVRRAAPSAGRGALMSGDGPPTAGSRRIARLWMRS